MNGRDMEGEKGRYCEGETETWGGEGGGGGLRPKQGNCEEE